MFLGLVIVLVVVGLIFNFFQKRRGDVVVPGSSDVVLENDDQTGVEEGGVYTVKAGDNLWSIAENRLGDGFAWEEIAKLNQIENPGLIEVGQKLIMPEIVAIDDKEVLVPENYTVVAGDNLWKISILIYGDGYAWPAVWQANRDKLNSPDLLEIGMVLTMPKLN